MGKNVIFDKVLFVGPDLNAQGGIASVLRSYSHCVVPFHYMRSNSAKGTLFGIIALIMLLLRLPYFKWVKDVRIVHIHGASGKSFVRKTLIIKWAKVLGYKVVFHNHGGFFGDYVEKRGREKIRNVLIQCDAIVALSNSWKEYFEQTFGFENVFVINNIVFPPTESASEIKKTTHSEPLKLLFMGLVCDNKGIFDLLDVVAKRKKNLEGKLEVYVGGLGEVERMNKLITENRLENIVKPCGWVAGSQKESLLVNCDVCVLPSYIEGVPISILEAMANGKAVIASSVGGIPELVENGKTGILHTPGDKEAIYNAIIYFLENPLALTTFGRAAKEKVAPYYPQQVAQELEKMYLKL